MTLSQDILEKLKQKIQMNGFRQNQQQLNNSPNFINNLGGKVSGLGMKLSQNPIQGVANLGSKVQGLGNGLQSFGNASKVANATGALGNAAPAVGAATGALNVGADLSKGDYTGAGLDALSTGAALAGGPVGMAVAAAAQIGKQLQAKQKQREAKAMQRSMEELQKTEQANAQDTAQLQNQFANDAQQSAQAMTQPQSLSQDIMSQINPDYTSSASGGPTGFAADINYPEVEQTLQNDQSAVPQNEDSNINFTPLQPIQVMEGKNGGAVIDKDATNALAQNQGIDLKQSILDKIKNNITQGNVLDKVKNGLSQFKAGYDDNSMNGFADGDLANQLASNVQPSSTPQNGVLTGGAAQTKKTLMNRIGEAAGTGRRLMANPWVQAGIAGLISKADGGDIGDMAKAAYQYGTAKSKADQYYKQMHPDAKVMPVLNTYGAEDYKAKAYNDYNQMRTNINAPTADEYYKQQFLQGYLTADEYKKIVEDPSYDPEARVNLNQVKQSQNNANNVRKTNIQENKNNWQRNVAETRASETERHNKVSEGQRSQSIANTKANNDRNYNLKVNKQNVKNAEEELKARGFKKVNGQWVKQ